MKTKYIPKVGDKLFTYTPCSNMWVSDVRKPWTVETVVGENMIIVREAKAVFLGARYYDTLPDYIEDDLSGKRMKMRWSEKHQRWQESPAGSYPKVAVFGKWDYQPYLN